MKELFNLDDMDVYNVVRNCFGMIRNVFFFKKKILFDFFIIKLLIMFFFKFILVFV